MTKTNKNNTATKAQEISAQAQAQPISNPIPVTFTVTDMRRRTVKDKDGKESKMWITHTWTTPKFVKNTGAIDAICKAYAYFQSLATRNAINEKRFALVEESKKGEQKDTAKMDKLKEEITELEYVISNYPQTIPTEDEALADKIALVCAWAHNPFWGKDKKDGDEIICHKWHFAQQEGLAITVNKFRKDWNAQPDSPEKSRALTALKAEITAFCNRYLPNGDSDLYKSRQLGDTEFKNKWLVDYVFPACYSGIKSHSMTDKKFGDSDSKRVIQTMLQVMYHGKCGMDCEPQTTVTTNTAVIEI